MILESSAIDLTMLEVRMSLPYSKQATSLSTQLNAGCFKRYIKSGARREVCQEQREKHMPIPTIYSCLLNIYKLTVLAVMELGVGGVTCAVHRLVPLNASPYHHLLHPHLLLAASP